MKTVLKWRKSSEFLVGNKTYIRYVLVCGMIVFIEKKSNSGEMVYSAPPMVITERELSSLHKELESKYVEAVIVNPLSKQEVTFSK